MASEFTIFRLEKVERAIKLLRETIERNCPPNDAIENHITDCEVEVSMLRKQLKQESK